MNKPTVLLIEDDSQLGASLSELLAYFEFDVELIHNGLLARQRLGEVIRRLVVLDLHLPGRSGIELLADIRADERLCKTRVLVTTADQLISIAQLRGADAVLSKPFTVEALQAAIGYLMNDEVVVSELTQRWPNGF